MIFRFLRKTLVLDCFTYDEMLLQTAPITYAIKHVPDWWKKLPNSYLEKDLYPVSTMKKCIGMVDYYTKSVAIPLWSDLVIDVDASKNFRWQFSDSQTEAAPHDERQRINLLNNHHHLKILTPWLLSTNKDINWVWSQPTYSFEKNIVDIKILPGILNFYRQNGININMLFPLDTPKKYFLPQGQVMAHLTPMTEQKIKIVRHLVSKKKYLEIANKQVPITFTDKYKSIFESKQKFLDCPYHKEK